MPSPCQHLVTVLYLKASQFLAERTDDMSAVASIKIIHRESRSFPEDKRSIKSLHALVRACRLRRYGAADSRIFLFHLGAANLKSPILLRHVHCPVARPRVACMTDMPPAVHLDAVQSPVGRRAGFCNTRCSTEYLLRRPGGQR